MLSKSDIGGRTPEGGDDGGAQKTPGASRTNNDRNVLEKNFISFNEGQFQVQDSKGGQGGVSRGAGA